MTWVMWNLACFRLETLLVSVQDWCMVCARRTIGSEIVFDASMERLGDMGHLDSRFFPFGDIVSVGTRLVHGLR